MIYLDNAATTEMSPGVIEVMTAVMRDNYGNPGTQYGIGREAKALVDDARSMVANSLGAKPKQIIFTSGGSEANSLVFSGMADYLKASGKDTIVVSAIEHDSVLKAAEYVCIKRGFHLRKAPVLSDGTLDFDALQEILEANKDRVGLVSIMYSNNEIGSVNSNIAEIAAMCKEHGAFFHTDCVQAFGFYETDAEKIGCDFLSVSSHKIHGPKGVGALFVSDRVRELKALNPIVFGGDDQEFGLRGGTENVPGIVGFARACAEIDKKNMKSISSVVDFFVDQLNEQAKEFGMQDRFILNAFSPNKPTKTLSITVRGIDNETLMLAIDRYGVCVGTGSACRSHEVSPSHVLKAIGLSDEDAMSTVRVSFSKNTPVVDAYNAARIFVSVCHRIICLPSAWR